MWTLHLVKTITWQTVVREILGNFFCIVWTRQPFVSVWAKTNAGGCMRCLISHKTEQLLVWVTTPSAVSCWFPCLPLGFPCCCFCLKSAICQKHCSAFQVHVPKWSWMCVRRHFRLPLQFPVFSLSLSPSLFHSLIPSSLRPPFYVRLWAMALALASVLWPRQRCIGTALCAPVARFEFGALIYVNASPIPLPLFPNSPLLISLLSNCRHCISPQSEAAQIVCICIEQRIMVH